MHPRLHVCTCINLLTLWLYIEYQEERSLMQGHRVLQAPSPQPASEPAAAVSAQSGGTLPSPSSWPLQLITEDNHICHTAS